MGISGGYGVDVDYGSYPDSIPPARGELMEYDSPMSCKKCGSEWGEIVGNVLVCKCGYRHTIPLKPTYEELEKRAEFLEAVIRRSRGGGALG